MSKKRNRRATEHSVRGANKKRRTSTGTQIGHGIVRHSLLSQYYPRVLTLVDYLLAKLPATLKKRRRKILCIKSTSELSSTIEGDFDKSALAKHLDLTLVGVPGEAEISEATSSLYILVSCRIQCSEFSAPFGPRNQAALPCGHSPSALPFPSFVLMLLPRVLRYRASA
jgi:hypothetical protein